MRFDIRCTVFVAALVLGLASAAFASPAPEAQDIPTCAPDFDLLAEEGAPQCKLELPDSGAVEPEWMAGYRGYCRCSCSSVKNCNTSADCGGSLCLKAISCC
jgi:hypothetical protein